MGYSKFIAERPCMFLSAVMTVVLGLSAVVQLLGWFTVAESTGFDWNVTESPITQKQDALNHAKANLEFVASQGGSVNRTDPYGSLYLIYQGEGTQENILVPETIKALCEAENVLLKQASYQDFCLKVNAAEGSPCMPPPLSIVHFMYGSNATAISNCDLLTDAEINVKLNQLKAAFYNPTANLAFTSMALFFLPNDFEANNPAGQAEVIIQRTRSQISWGGPLEEGRIEAGATNAVKQEYYIVHYFEKAFADLFAHLGLEGGLFNSPLNGRPSIGSPDNPVEVLMYSGILQSLEFKAILGTDLSAALASIVFVLLYMTIYSRSLLVSSMSVLQIVLSVPVSLFFYNAFFQVYYFSNMHILVIFLVLGVGADDVFVFLDKWKQCDSRMSVEERLSETISHTLAAVFNTSFTTAVAFASTGISPLMPISAFGIFAAIAIVVNYVFCVTITPAVVILMHNRSQRKSKVADAIEVRKVAENDGEEHVVVATGCFAKLYLPLMKHKAVAAMVFIGCIAFMGITFAHALQLTTPEEEEQFFSSSHMFTGISTILSNDFMGGETSRYMTLSFVLGIDSIERPLYNRWAPDLERGYATYDEDFDLSVAQAQLDVVAMCENLRDAPCDLSACAQGPLDDKLLHTPDSLDCVMEDYHTYLLAQNPNATTVEDVIVEGDAFHTSMRAYLGTPIGGKYASKVGFSDEGKVQLLVITGKASVLTQQPNGVMEPYYNALVDYLETNFHPTSTLQSLFVDSGRNFTWMTTQIELVKGMFSGLAICFPVAFVVLLLATQNIVLAFYATFSIASIVAAVLGLAQILGWNLGMAESIAAVIVIGFSVDYTVHLGHMYEEAANRHDRWLRVEEAVTKMGHTVMAGAVTTFGSGAVMFICQMAFFYKMAVLICLTIFLSVIYSLGFFMATCALFGPQNHSGDIGWMIPCVKSKHK